MRLSIRIGLAALVVASMAVVVSSSGFTSTEADRTATVTIVEDEDAYVGLSHNEEVTVDVTDATTDVDTTVTEFTATYGNASMVQNQFVVDIDVAVEVVDREESAPEIRFVLDDEESSSGVESGSADHEAHVPTGESAVFDAEVSCEAEVDDEEVSARHQSGNVTVEYRATGTGVSAMIEREITVTCDDEPAV